MVQFANRLPGVYFEPPPLPDDEVLPRMDIAMFVGFASKGVPHLPVAVEDAAQFVTQFGDDVELCWDNERGEIVYGYLGAAVRAFFRNGGRRCWVVRIPHGSATPPRTILDFKADVFLDPRLQEAESVDELETLLDFYRSQQAGRANLKGIYAALDPGHDYDMEEVTIIAVPDAVHLGWTESQPLALPPPLPSAPLDHPEWWHFMGCRPVADRIPEKAELSAPLLTTSSRGVGNNVTLLWTWDSLDVYGPLPRFIVEQARRPDWRDATVVYRGSLLTCTLHLDQPGDYYLRVRVASGNRTSDWSNAIRVSVQGARAGLDRAEFQRCDLVVLPAPYLAPALVTDKVIWLSWTWSLPDSSAWSPVYILEEARLGDWRDAAEIYRGSDAHFILRGRQEGGYYYRVRVTARGETSDWSNGIGANVIGARRLLLNKPGSTDELLNIHKRLMLVCATRGDCFAVLGVPRSMQANDVQTYALTLRAAVDERTRSFGAIYYPWLYGRDDLKPELVRANPPDGAQCGVMAARSARRGAWISPANEPLQNVFALDPRVREQDFLPLEQGSVNQVIQGPRGFVTLSAQTLSSDADWHDINVRRLICLLRRLALKHGVRYLFEPNDQTFRRAIQHGFENLMRQLFLQGAFAGRVATDAYQVVVDESVNTRQRMDLGELVIELRVAPSRPLKFLSVQLVQSHDRTLVKESV